MNTRSKKILIIAEHAEKMAYELLSAAKEIGELTPVTVKAVFIGEQRVTPSMLKPVINEYQPDIIIAAHTSAGIEFLPGLAAVIGAACITGVKKISQESGEIRYTRSIYNGKFDAVMRSEKEITAITILPGAFNRFQDTELFLKPENLVYLEKTDTIVDDRIVLEKIIRTAPSDFSFDDALMIVAAGRGIGKKEHLDKIRKFADMFQRSAVAGSRPLIDSGWLAYKHQVGITGKTVAPKIYIACGISGSTQHTAGMSGSEYIIAINTDPDAAIFNISDIFIIEDVISFIDALLIAVQQNGTQEA